MPKGFRKQLKLVPQIVGTQRREELLDNIADRNGFLPQGVHIKDMDTSFVDYVSKDLRIEIDGEEVPVVFLTIQRYADFKKTWKFTDEYKNIKMPFVTIVRNPDIQKGTNQAALANIPGQRNYSYYKVPSNDGSRLGVDIYKIPQPTAVDITYEVRFFSNKMSDVNVMHKKVHKAFNATQAYIYPKQHPMPITLPTITDESNIEDFEARRFYVEAYEMLLAGYILDEKDFEVNPTINRMMVLNEIAIDPETAEPLPNQNKRTPVIRTQGSVIIRDSADDLITTTDCNSTYVVGNSDIINSGATFSVSVPATSGYTLPNITHYDCDGSTVILPAQTSFSATPFCLSGTVINSGVTYSGTVAAGGTLQLPNINVSVNSLPLYVTPSVVDVNIDTVNGFDPVGAASGVSWFVSASTITNSGNTYTQNVPAESGFTLPNIINYDSDSSPVVTPAMVGFTATTCDPVTIANSGSTYSATTPAGSTFVLPNVTNYDGDSSPVVTPAMVGFTATTCSTGGTVTNSTSAYTANAPVDSTLVLPDTSIFSSASGFTDTTPSVSTGYTIDDITWIDSNGVTGTTEYGNLITCTPVTPTLSVDVQMYSDSGTTSAITATTFGETVYAKILTTGATGIEYYNFDIPQGDGTHKTFSQTGDTYTWTVGAYGDWCLSGSVKDVGVATAYSVSPADVHLGVAAYERPSDWLTLPTITGGTSTEEINGLFAVWDRSHNYVTVQCTGDFTVNWGDGGGDINYGTGVIAERDIVYSATSSATTTSDGYRQVLIKVTPQDGSNLTDFDLANAHTNGDSITSIGWLDIQMQAENLTTMRIRNTNFVPMQLEQFDFLGTSNITTYLDMFEDCSGLRSVPNLATNSATNMTDCFRDCYSLTNIGTMDLSNVTNFSTTYYNCQSLTYLKIDTPAATNFTNIFGYNYSLETVDFVDSSNVTLFSNAFISCHNLSYLRDFDTSSATSYYRFFLNCYSISRLPTLSGALVTTTREMCKSCYGLEEYQPVDYPLLTTWTSMFSSCMSLQNAPAFDTGSVTNFDAFPSCYSLESIGLFDTSNFTSFASAFINCYSLLEVPLFDTSNVLSFDSTFSGCHSLVRVPLLDTSSATTLRRMFINCYSIIVIPALVTTINANLNDTFRNCSALQEINITDWSALTNVSSIFASAVRLSRVRNCDVPITITFLNCQLEEAELEEIYTDLPVVAGKTITVTGNPGAATADGTIASAKGWTVIT